MVGFQNMQGRNHRCDFWVMIEPAEDLPGQWVGHCLNLDVMSMGESPEQAWKMTREVIALTLLDDLTAGRNPLDRPSAPPEYWKRLKELQDNGVVVPLNRAFEQKLTKLAAIMSFEIVVQQQPPEVVPDVELPPAWLIERLSGAPGCPRDNAR